MTFFVPIGCWISRFHSTHFGFSSWPLIVLNPGAVKNGAASWISASVPPALKAFTKAVLFAVAIENTLFGTSGENGIGLDASPPTTNWFTNGELRAKRSISVAGK